jgi:hypothetical protein
MKTQLTIVAILVMLALTGCHKHEAHFVGKWEKITGDGPTTCDISKSGEQYSLKNPVDGNIGAAFKDGQLIVGGGVITIEYIQQSDHIIVIGTGSTNEYARIR